MTDTPETRATSAMVGRRFTLVRPGRSFVYRYTAAIRAHQFQTLPDPRRLRGLRRFRGVLGDVGSVGSGGARPGRPGRRSAGHGIAVRRSRGAAGDAAGREGHGPLGA